MSDAPENIYADPDPDDGWRWPRASKFPEQGPRQNVGYTRTDLIQPLIDAAVAKALEEAAGEIKRWWDTARDYREPDELIRAIIPASGTDALRQARDWGLGKCDCGMTGPCMWDQCKHPLIAREGGE